jgi:transcriptional antiterminator Rof (Rho-off)
MLRRVACLVAVLCLTGLVMGQKDKDKGKDAKTKATLVSVDAKKGVLVVEIDGKKKELTADKSTKFFGPKGGRASIKDDRLKPGAELGLVMDGDKLKEVHLPYRSKKDKSKEKDTKDKDKEKK